MRPDLICLDKCSLTVYGTTVRTVCFSTDNKTLLEECLSLNGASYLALHYVLFFVLLSNQNLLRANLFNFPSSADVKE